MTLARSMHLEQSPLQIINAPLTVNQGLIRRQSTKDHVLLGEIEIPVRHVHMSLFPYSRFGAKPENMLQ